MKNIKMTKMIKAENELTRIRRTPNHTPEAVESARLAFVATAAPLQAELDVAQAKCHARLICPVDIIGSLKRAQAHLDAISLKRDQVGTRINVDVNAQAFPNKYKGIPESTHYEAELTKTGWEITAIARRECRNRASGNIRFVFSDALVAGLATKLGAA
jgi:hypothetical protein